MGDRDFLYQSTDERRMSGLSNRIEGIQLAHRDICVSRRHVAWNLATAAGERARQLSSSIGARYATRFLRRLQPNLVFFRGGDSIFAPVQNSDPHVALVQRHQAAFNLSPRIALTVISWPQQSAERSHSPLGSSPVLDGALASVPSAYLVAPSLPAIQLRSIQKLWREASQLATNHTMNAHQRIARLQQQLRDERQMEIVTRLKSRSNRFDGAEKDQDRPAALLSAPTGPAGSPVPPHDLSPTRPVRRVLRRPPHPVEASVAEGQPAPDNSFNSSRRAAWPKHATEVNDLPAVDINRLTEQVVRTIDRRIIAYRERMGRM